MFDGWRGADGFRLAGMGVALVVAFFVGDALAGSTATKLCIPEAAGQPVKTPATGGKCAKKYKLTELGAEGPRGEKGEAGAPGTDGTSIVARVRSTGPFELPSAGEASVPLSGATWTQGAEELQQVATGHVVFTVPYGTKCADGEYPYAEVRLLLESKTATGGEGGQLGWARSNGGGVRLGPNPAGTITESIGEGLGWWEEPGTPETHLVTAKARESCNGGEEPQEQVTVDSIALDVIGAR